MTAKKYNEMNELLEEHSRLSAEMATVEAEVNLATLDAARPMLPQHAELKTRLGDIEGKLRTMAVENPELFPDDKKTHATPFGSVSFRTSRYLDLGNDEEKVVLKIKDACHREMALAQKHDRAPRFRVEQLIRTHEAPNVEALEGFEDHELIGLFGVERKTEEKFSVKPLEVKADKLAKKLEPAGAGATRHAGN